MDNKLDMNKLITKCPGCGSERRFFETMATEIKERGLGRKEWNHSYDARQGVVADSTKLEGLLIGTELPAYQIKTDICMDCGMIYATELKRFRATKGLDVSQTPIKQMLHNN